MTLPRLFFTASSLPSGERTGKGRPEQPRCLASVGTASVGTASVGTAALAIALLLSGCHSQSTNAASLSSRQDNRPPLHEDFASLDDSGRPIGVAGSGSPDKQELPAGFETSWRLAYDAWGSSDAAGGIPRPERLSANEWARVTEGWTVSRPFDFELAGHRYVGGVAYQIIAADSQAILETLTDAEQLPLALPLTQEAHQVGGASSLWGHQWGSTGRSPRTERVRAGVISEQAEFAVELRQGNSLLKARYTLRLQREDKHALKFALDAQRPHDIRDARGYFTADQISDTHSLVTVFVGVDLGGGIAQAFFKGPVQRAALAAPAHLRRYLEPLAQRDRVARAAAEDQRQLQQRRTVAASN